MITVRLANKHDCKFLEECINKDWQINDKYAAIDDWYNDFGHGNIEDYNELDYIRLYCNPNEPQDIYIVNNGQKDVGFFTQDIDTTNATIGGTAWVHPRSCKMSILKIVKAIVLRAHLLKSDPDFSSYYKYCEFNTWHPLIASTVQSICPSVQSFNIRSDYRIMYCPFENMSDTEYLKNKFNITDIDKNHCFAFDER